jgi:hypothetical protein
MPETEWNDGFRMVEVIGLTGPDERVVCLIGTRPPANKVVRFETYRGDTLVYEENFGIGPGLPMAALLNDLEEGFRKDAAVRDIPPEFDRLSVLQARVRDAVRSGNRYHDPAIATALANVQFRCTSSISRRSCRRCRFSRARARTRPFRFSGPVMSCRWMAG